MHVKLPITTHQPFVSVSEMVAPAGLVLLLEFPVVTELLDVYTMSFLAHWINIWNTISYIKTKKVNAFAKKQIVIVV